jgi:DNA polymerase
MTTRLFLDTETYSETPIGAGTHRYAETVEVMLFAWAIDDGPVSVWDVTTGEAMPQDLFDAIIEVQRGQREAWAHNMAFDRTVLRKTHTTLHPARVDLRLDSCRCSMVQAYMHSLPGSLDKLCAVLNVPQDLRKLKTGKELVRLFCQPRPKNMKLRRATRLTHPEEWARFVEYAGGDIVSMRECVKRMPKWNATPREWALWHLDQRINDRGIAIDTALVEAAIRAAGTAKADLAERTQALTEGDVRAATQRDELLRHLLLEHGVELPDMKADTLERRMTDPDLPGPVRELLAIRLQASSTSVAKYGTLAKSVGSDGRIRGTLQFRGAARTGRWAGRIFQPQNLPRPTLPQADIDLGIEAVKNGCEALLYDNVMELLSNAVRGTIVAPPGRKLVIADLSNIEGRVAAWLAGEHWKLRAFRDFDAGTGPDLYKVAYGKAFAVDPASVTKDQRQIGKVMELMLQYQGGVGAFITGAATYGIDLSAMADKALPSVPRDVLVEAEEFWGWSLEQKRPTYGLEQRVFVACDALKRLWRRAHPAISSIWSELEDAIRAALRQPGSVHVVRRLKVRAVPGWLQVRLPSGRNLCYPAPHVGDDGSITYMGQDQYTRQWKRLGSYGGKFLENFTQAVAGDQLAECMPGIEAAGYLPVLSVHDEELTETPDSEEFTADRLAELMTADLGWNEGLPLAAAGYETYRYRKD